MNSDPLCILHNAYLSIAECDSVIMKVVKMNVASMTPATYAQQPTSHLQNLVFYVGPRFLVSSTIGKASVEQNYWRAS